MYVSLYVNIYLFFGKRIAKVMQIFISAKYFRGTWRKAALAFDFYDFFPFEIGVFEPVSYFRHMYF